MQSTDAPLKYMSNVEPNQLQTTKKRKKTTYGNYEVFESNDDSASLHNLQPKAVGSETYQSYSPTVDNSKYAAHYSSSIPENTRPHQTSSYGKRKKTKKSRRTL